MLPEISIHTPAWGVTVTTVTFDGVELFQSTHPRGV